mmetsp:Transcript_46325/g.68359  ORF Transcript_46325/g.68359 Transcript_46325/m.68359 type:complete len:234 (-) Transcript_46325:130-831(-)|eukprot:CAMPEP_0195518870 /NCGR_PEP_ID=MMETSP0794_2-20130614/13835_1 /TAXON_ID=515487 /ORGANISM="Stephanopyxis turris, Strain CCMP 815" /LENGTH=233 /DNA_ID=CAMNT_0040647901 /DNA_START=81 /DNA_END=782 /DNA_ORIENTATION=-
MSSEKVQVYYWPFLGRGAAALLMLTEAGVDFEHISDFPHLAQKCAAFGAQTTTFAPPIVVDGDTVVSQSLAVAQYIGKKHFPMPDDNDTLGFQVMLNLVDFGGGLEKATATPQSLKTFFDGDGQKPARFHLWAATLERTIKGPFFFGEKPTYVDFLWAGHYGFMHQTVFASLSERTGVDYFEKYPKLTGVYDAITSLESFQKLGLPFAGPNFVKKPDDVIFAEFPDKRAASAE